MITINDYLIKIVIRKGAKAVYREKTERQKRKQTVKDVIDPIYYKCTHIFVEEKNVYRKNLYR